MADIFISYASGDLSRVEPLAKVLEDQGWSVWWDRTIPPGKSFDQVIQEAIMAAKCVVVLWSNKSIKSDWVKEEATIGKRRQILVPAKIDSVDPPLGFGLIQAADLTNWETETSHAGFESFRSAISDIVGPPPQKEKGEQVAEIPESNLDKHIEAQPEEKKILRPKQLQQEPTQHKTIDRIPKQKQRKKIALVIGGVVLIAAFSLLAVLNYDVQNHGIRPIPNVKTVQVDETIVSKELKFPGVITALDQYNLSFPIEGLLKEFLVNTGEFAKKGQILAKIENNDLSYEKMELENQITKAKSQLDLKIKELKRAKKLYDQGAASRKHLDSSNRNAVVSEANLKSLVISLERIRDQLSHTNLKAPFDGLITNRLVDINIKVKQDQPIFRILKHSDMGIVFNIPANLKNYVENTESSRVMFSAYPKEHIFTVIKSISKETDPSTRTYKVILVPKNQPEISILPGMTCDVYLTTSIRGVEINKTAVFVSEENNSSYVWVIDPKNKTVNPQKVEIIEIDDPDIFMIVRGLNAGKLVAVSNTEDLVEGEKVNFQ